MTFEEVCDKLKLEYTSDWGIINSDGSRVEEFIQFVNERDDLEFSTRCEFVDLIFQSMNDAILEGRVDSDLETLFFNYVKSVKEGGRYWFRVDYWFSFSSESKEEFPIQVLLEKYNAQNQSET